MEIDTDKLNRLEIIDHREDSFGQSSGRTVIVGGPAYNERQLAHIELSVQDDGRTLKIFIEDKSNEG